MMLMCVLFLASANCAVQAVSNKCLLYVAGKNFTQHVYGLFMSYGQSAWLLCERAPSNDLQSTAKIYIDALWLESRSFCNKQLLQKCFITWSSLNFARILNISDNQSCALMHILYVDFPLKCWIDSLMLLLPSILII